MYVVIKINGACFFFIPFESASSSIVPGVDGCPCIHEINRRVGVASYHGPVEGRKPVRLQGSKDEIGFTTNVYLCFYIYPLSLTFSTPLLSGTVPDSLTRKAATTKNKTDHQQSINAATTSGRNKCSNATLPAYCTVRWSTPSPLATYAATSTLTTSVLSSMVAITNAVQPSTCTAHTVL